MGGKQSQEEAPAAAPAAAPAGRRQRQQEPAAPTLQDASQKLDQQVSALELKIQKADADAKQWVAKAATNPTAKARAMQCLKMKKQYEDQRDKLMGTQFNIENMKFQQESAELTATTVAALAAGRDRMKAMQAQINMDSVDRVMDDIADLSAENAEVQDALARSSLVGSTVDETDLEAEWARMEEEAALEKIMQGGALPAGSATAATAAPAAVAAPAAAAPSAPARMAA